MRHWLDTYSEGGIPWSDREKNGKSRKLRLPSLSLDDLTNRYEAHGKSCRHCQRTLALCEQWVPKLTACGGVMGVLVGYAVWARHRGVLITAGGILALIHWVRDRLRRLHHMIMTAVPYGAAAPRLKVKWPGRDAVFDL